MSNALELKKQKEEHLANAPSYSISKEDKAAQDFFEDRKTVLKEYRKKYEQIWNKADVAYIPHSLNEKGKKILVSDDELGWRSTQITLGSDKWQEDSISPNPYIKIQTALGIIVDRNPTGIFSPGSKKYQKNTPLIQNLYARSWDIAKSKEQLKLFVFNQAKYGIGIARTFPLKLERQGHVYYDDIFRENLDPRTVWLDNNTKPGNKFSCNDWIYYKDYDWDRFVEQFGHLENFKYVKITSANKENEDDDNDNEKVRVWFYENLSRDNFFVQTDDNIVLVNEELPQPVKNKRLSCWFAPWTIRSANEIHGIGVYEAMRNDYKIATKIRNMSTDQLTLSIYKEFFFEGTDNLEGDGQMLTRPGKGRQVVNPQNVRWNEIPGPGQESIEWLKYFEQLQEKSTGITATLEGAVIGKTAFETAQAREMALRRMKTPLDNILNALETEAYITLTIIEDLYSLPKIEELAEPRFIEQWNEAKQEMEIIKQTTQEVPKEFPLKVEKDKEGNIIETDKEEFLEISPEDLPWEGVVKIKAQSILAQSELLERTTKLEMANIVIPLLEQPEEIVGKAAKQIIKVYGEDPKDWLPDSWLQEKQKPLFVPQGQQPVGQQPQSPQQPQPVGGQAQTVQPSTQIRPQQGMVGNFINKINPFTK